MGASARLRPAPRRPPNSHTARCCGVCVGAADWREWGDDVTRWVKADEAKGDAMSAGDAELLQCSGYLLRQGSLVAFNYHRSTPTHAPHAHTQNSHC